MVIGKAGPRQGRPKTPRSKRRSFPNIRLNLLKALSGGRSTVNDLSRKTGINWKTVDNHLIYLCGRGWAEKVFDSTYVKIFDLTEDGRSCLLRAQRKNAPEART